MIEWTGEISSGLSAAPRHWRACRKRPLRTRPIRAIRCASWRASPREAAVNAALYPRLNFVFLRDIAPVAGVIRVPMVVLVHPSLPATTIAELIAYAKDNPGKINLASAGTGSAPHMPIAARARRCPTC